MESSGASSEHARRTMIANGSRDTKPELALGSILHSRGLRFRVSFSPSKAAQSRAAIVFTKAKIDDRTVCRRVLLASSLGALHHAQDEFGLLVNEDRKQQDS